MRVLGNASDDANGLLVLANINDCTRRIPPSSFHQGIHHASVPFLKRHSTIRHRITMLDYIKRENRVKQPIAFHQKESRAFYSKCKTTKSKTRLRITEESSLFYGTARENLCRSAVVSYAKGCEKLKSTDRQQLGDMACRTS
jgi:hypothetical protein